MYDYDFANKSCILDTNVLSALAGKGRGSEKFRPVFEFLAKNSSCPFILEATKFEFLGYSTNKKDYERVKSWLSSFPGMWVDTVRVSDYELATELSAMYKCKNSSISPKQISFVDCLHAAMLCRFKDRSFIITTDLNDYPSFLFDMPHHIAIEGEGGETFFVGFKVFNQEKFDSLKEAFEKTG